MPVRHLLTRAVRLLAVMIALACATAAGAAPREVRVGAFVTSLSGLDFADGSFRIAAFLWFVDPAGTFDPVRDLQVLARQSTLAPAERLVLPDGAVYSTVQVTAVVDQSYDLRNFPFSRQSLILRLETSQEIGDLIFVADNADSRIADFVRLPSWNITALRLEPSQETYDTGFGHRTERPTFSRMNLMIDVARDRSPLIFDKFTGFLVAMIITALVFAVPVNELGIRLAMTTSSIFAAVFNRYRLEDTVGFDASFSLMDQVSLLTFGAILTALVISLVAHNLNGRRSPSAIRLVDRRLGIGAMIVYGVLLVAAFFEALT